MADVDSMGCRARRCLATGLIVCAFLAGSARGQLIEEAHPELGLNVTRPRAYESLPLPPREGLLRLAWRIPAQPGVLPVTLSVAILEPGAAPADTLAFLKNVLDPDSAQSLRGGAKRYGMRPVRFEFSRTNDDGQALRGLLLGWEGEQRAVLVIGEGPPAAFNGEAPRWRRVADSLRMLAPRLDERGRNPWERHYAKGRYLGEARRIEERMRLPQEWSARDTLHYLVLANVSDEALVRRVASELEILRARLARDLPPPVAYDGDAASVVRICADRDEYLAYGGLPQAVGHFSSAEAELVLYLGSSMQDTMETLYHEAFHQYVFHSTGGVAPHPWFDEGMGEYYAGTRFETGRIAGIEPLVRHAENLRELLAAGRWTTLAVLLRLDRGGFYADPVLHYAQGWSLVSFLRSAPQARGRPSWGGLLDRYFLGLASAWSQELELARPTGRLEVAPARAKALAAAMGAALEGVDLDELEQAWKLWIQDS